MQEKISRRKILKAGAISAGALSTGWAWSEGVPPAFAAATNASAAANCVLDTLVLGDTTSETAHSIATTLSDVVTGGLGQPARVFNPTDPVSYWGGTATFTMACAPTGTTYITVKLWGGDDATGFDDETIAWRLQLFAEGKQVGYQEQSAVDSLDIMCDEPRLPGRFYFHTLPLPEALTSGKTSIQLEIRAEGRIWPYGQNTSQFYYNLTGQSRGVYRMYTHTTPYFTPAQNDPQGPAPVPTIRQTPGEEVFEQVKMRVQNELTNWLYVPMTDLWAIVVVAEAYFVPGNPCYQNDAAIDRVLSDLDAVYYLWIE